MATKESAAAVTKPGTPEETTQKCKVGPIVVVIDPGHGDIFRKWLDPGSVHPNPLPKTGGWLEKDLALKVSKAMKLHLEENKALVKAAYLTRESDLDDKKRVRYKWRIDVAKEKDARVFVSVHLDSAGATASGHHVVYRPEFAPDLSLKLATEINKTYSLIAATSEPVRTQSLGVLALGDTNVKAGVLVELGFISNDNNRRIVDEKADKVASEIATGVLAFIKENLETLCQEKPDAAAEKK